MSIILLGNGKSILGSSFGKTIDQFHDVIRLNNYVTVGHEADCGSKTTYWARQAGEKVVHRKLSQYKRAFVFVTYCRWTKILKQNAANLSQLGYKIISEDFSKALGQKLGLRQPDEQWPSVGLLAVEFFTRLYPEVWIAGFDGTGVSHYYSYTPSDSQAHDWIKEQEYLASLQKLGKLRPLAVSGP